MSSKSNKRSDKRSSKSKSKSASKEETPVDIIMVSGHGSLIDEKKKMPSDSVYLYDVHCGVLSFSKDMEDEFFKKRIPEDSTYLSSWIMNTTNDKLGSAPVLVKRPNEYYYDSEISFILDYRYIGDKQNYELIDECDKITVQKSGIYSYNQIKTMEEEFNIRNKTVLNCAYIDKKGKMKILPYDYELRTNKKALQKLAKKHPEAKPFYIITKNDLREIYEGSIYPTVEDLELFFDDDVDYMRYTDFHESLSIYDKTVSECIESYKNKIVAVPSCRSSEEIAEPRMHQIQSDSFGEAESRLILNKDTKYFSSSPRSSRRKNSKSSSKSHRNSRKKSSSF